MQKRGQITIFIIIGILILCIIAGFLLLKGKIVEEEVKVEEEKIIESVQLGGGVQNYVENCIEKTGREALIFIGEQGGYYELPEVYDPDFKLPYYFYEENDLSPSKDKVEEELAKYMEEMLFFCVEGFEYFKEKGYEIEQGEIESGAEILEGKVKFKVNFPVYMVKGSVGKELLFFETDIPSRLKTILEVNGELMEGVLRRPYAVNLGQISDLSIENDLMIGLSDLENDVYFTVVDKKTLYEEEIYDFNFVVEYLFGQEIELK